MHRRSTFTILVNILGSSLLLLLSVLSASSVIVVAAFPEFRIDTASTRIEAKMSASASWGTVAWDATSTSSDNTAEAMCRLLGYTKVSSSSITKVGGGSGTILFSDIYCVAKAEFFQRDCTYVYLPPASSYTHADDAGISCSGLRYGGTRGVYSGSYYLRLTDRGRVEVRQPFAEPWSTVGSGCSASAAAMTDTTATQLCNFILGSGGTGTFSIASKPGVGSILMTDLVCGASSTSMSDCTYNTNTAQTSLCSHTANDAAVICSATQNGVLSGDYYFRINPASGRFETRTVDQTSSNSAWNYVCFDQQFHWGTSQFFCNFLGFPSPLAWPVWPKGGTNAATASGSMQFSQMSCPASATELSACSYQVPPTASSCSVSYAVGLICPIDTNTSSSTADIHGVPWRYQLRMMRNGRLEARLRSTGSWGSVCDDLWSTTTSSKICQFLGKGDRGTYFNGVEGKGAIFLDNVQCPSSATSFEDCTGNSFLHNCDHSEDVGLSCYTFAEGVDIGGGYRARLGDHQRLEVRLPGTTAWGSVCSTPDATATSTTTMTDTTATALCRMIGYKTLTTASVISSVRAPSSTTTTTSDTASTTPLLYDISCSSKTVSGLTSCMFYTASNASSSQLSVCGDVSHNVGIRCGRWDNTPATGSSWVWLGGVGEIGVVPILGIVFGVIGAIIVFVCALWCYRTGANRRGVGLGGTNPDGDDGAMEMESVSSAETELDEDDDGEQRHTPSSSSQPRNDDDGGDNDDSTNPRSSTYRYRMTREEREADRALRTCVVCGKTLRTHLAFTSHMARRHPNDPIPQTGVEVVVTGAGAVGGGAQGRPSEAGRSAAAVATASGGGGVPLVGSVVSVGTVASPSSPATGGDDAAAAASANGAASETSCPVASDGASSGQQQQQQQQQATTAVCSPVLNFAPRGYLQP